MFMRLPNGGLEPVFSPVMVRNLSTEDARAVIFHSTFSKTLETFPESDKPRGHPFVPVCHTRNDETLDHLFHTCPCFFRIAGTVSRLLWVLASRSLSSSLLSVSGTLFL